MLAIRPPSRGYAIGKRREEKPFAVMYPSLEAVREDCAVSELEERLLLSSESPIVLLRRLERRTTHFARPSRQGTQTSA